MSTPAWWRWWLPSAAFALVLLIIAVTAGASLWLSVVIAGAIFIGSLVTADNNRRLWREARESWLVRRRRYTALGKSGG